MRLHHQYSHGDAAVLWQSARCVNLPLSSLRAIPASFIGRLISGLLQEASGGGYTATFVLVVIFGLISLVACACLKRP